MESIHYSIFPVDPGAHLFEVLLWIRHPDPAGQQLSLATWIPGSYLIREFSRHIDRVSAISLPDLPDLPVAPPDRLPGRKRAAPAMDEASAPPPLHAKLDEIEAGASPVSISKISKNRWRCAPVTDAGHGLLLRYRVYAWDLSVRTAHLDESHGFFNGSSVFLRVDGQQAQPCSIDIFPPAGARFAEWRIATTLPRPGQAARPRQGRGGARAQSGDPDSSTLAQTRNGQFGPFRAANHDELIDHPVEMGCFQHAHFDVGGCRHEIAITGKASVDFERLVRDLKKICQAQIQLFEPGSKRAPVDRYVFMTMAVDDGYGGLEHRASTALLCARDDLPWPGMTGTPANYQTFLGLASHEYFHTWHVKRIKPERFAPYELDHETYTELLWVFEGFTSYYDDLMLVRSGVITEADYLKLLEQNIRRVSGNPGRFMQSVAESSMDAWIKYYRPDENTNNTVSSYYVKGALVALCLDLTIRERTGSRCSLDDVMRLMWQRYGRTFYRDRQGGKGIAEDGMPALVKEATGLDLSRQIRAWAYGTRELPLPQCLKPFGLKIVTEDPEQAAASLGARTALRQGELAILATDRDGPASRAGLSAGDRLVAVDGLRCTEQRLKTLLARSRPGDRVEVVAFRRDELLKVEVELAQPPGQASLLTSAGKNPARALWLGQPLRRAGKRTA